LKVAVVISSNDPETIWNALRYANTALGYDDDVTVFLIGQGVEAASIQSLKFDIDEQLALLEEYGGTLIGCGVCCEQRQQTMPKLLDDLQCTIGSMQDFYIMTKECDKILTF
jgi:uncharacterized protein involved in oxidation of intracellular sulfur